MKIAIDNENSVNEFFYYCRSIQRKYTTGRPDQKDLNENLAATQGLSHMITECQRLFQVRIYTLLHFVVLFP